MDASTLLYKAGKLTEAIEAQLSDVKSHPLDPGQRLFLFDLLLFSGDVDRARRHIDAVPCDSAEQAAGVAMYRQLLESELMRRRVFAEGLSPTFLGDEIPDHVRHRLEAVNRLREGHAAQALEEIEKAEKAAPVISGEMDGKPFSFFRDCDDLFSGILEVMAGGQYLWVPLERIESIVKGAPEDPSRPDLRAGDPGIEGFRRAGVLAGVVPQFAPACGRPGPARARHRLAERRRRTRAGDRPARVADRRRAPQLPRLAGADDQGMKASGSGWESNPPATALTAAQRF